jgi:hypothetical protein
MAGKIQFTLNGEAQQFAGAVTGKGSLKLEMDATSLCFAMDYKSLHNISVYFSLPLVIKYTICDICYQLLNSLCQFKIKS